MNNVFTNVVKKHTNVWQNNMLLPNRFVYENPGIPDAQEKEKKTGEKKKSESGREEINTQKLEGVFRKAIAGVLSKKQNTESARDLLGNTETLINEILRSLRMERVINEIRELLKAENKTPIQIRHDFETAITEIAKFFGIPKGAQRALMFEFTTGEDIQQYMQNFDMFLSGVLRHVADEYRKFIEAVLDEKVFGKDEREGEPKGSENRATRIRDRILKKIEQLPADRQLKIQEEFAKAITNVTNPIIDKACNAFLIDANDNGVRNYFRIEPSRTTMLEAYGIYKECGWQKNQIKNDKALHGPKWKRDIKSLEKMQVETAREMEIIKQRAKIESAIGIYGLDNLDLGAGDESLADRLLRNQDMYESSSQSIKKCEKDIVDAGREKGREMDEEKKAKIQENIEALEKNIINEKKEQDRLRKLIDFALSKYNPSDINRDENTRREKGAEILKTTRQQAAEYLMKEGEWLHDKYYSGDSFFQSGDKEKIQNMLLGTGNEGNVMTDKQVLDYFEMQKQYEKNPSGNPPFMEFQNFVRSSTGAASMFMATNMLYDNILKKYNFGEKNYPGSKDEVTESMLKDFIEQMCDLSIADQADEDKKNRLKAVKGIVSKYLGGDPKKTNLAYYPPHIPNADFGKRDNEMSTLGEKGREMVAELLKTYRTCDRGEIASKISEIVDRDWNNGLYSCILKYDKDLRKIEGEQVKKKGVDEDESADPLKSGYKNASQFARNMMGGWHMLNWLSVMEMFKTGFEGVRRHYRLKNERAAAEAGYIVAQNIPFWGDIFKSEFLKLKQQKENEEVNDKKGNYEQFGYAELIAEMHSAPNRFTLKAVLITLSQKGYLMRNDLLNPLAIKRINKLLHANIPVPSVDPDQLSPDQKADILDQMRSVFDGEWGQGTLDGWFSGSDSSRESNVQKNYTLIQKMSGAEKIKLFNDLVKTLIRSPEEYKKKYPIDVTLGYMRQEIMEGNIDCNYHLAFFTMLRLEGIIDDDHIEELRVKHANDYPSYAILKKAELEHSGIADHYRRVKADGSLFRDGKLQENCDLMQFFINRKKLRVKAKKNGNFWNIATSEKDTKDPSFIDVDIFASDLHQRRAATLQYVDNSNAPVYFRSYDVNEVIGSVYKISSSGNMENIKRGHDITAMLAGSHYTPIFANLLAATEAAKAGDKRDFMHQVQATFYDLRSSYFMIQHLSQHKERMRTELDPETGIPSKTGKPKPESKSFVVADANLYYQMVGAAKINRLDEPAVKEVAEDFAKVGKEPGRKIKSLIDNMFGLNYIRNNPGDRKMLGFKPWEYFWEAKDEIEQYLKKIGGDMYNEGVVKPAFTRPPATNASTGKMAP